MFGAGLGQKTEVENTNVTLALPESQALEKDNEDSPLNDFSVYGGGEKGTVTGQSAVTVNRWSGDVYGGGKGVKEGENLIDANAKTTNVTVSGALMGNVYGGGELATVGTSGETDIVTHVTLETTAKLFHSEVFGGGRGEMEKEFATIYGSTEVVVNGGTADEHSPVFGGGQNASVQGNTNVTLNGGTYDSVFGGNEMSGEIKGSINVTIPEDSSVKVAHLLGGGREAPYDGLGTNVSIAGGTTGNAYGGGFGQGAVALRTNITITGGRVDTLYGGGEEATVTESVSIKVNVEDNTEAIGTLYCGNNQADMEIQPTLELTDGKIGTLYGGGNQGAMTVKDGLVYNLNAENIEIGTVYGGCNKADVPGGVKLTLTKGIYGTVYGGNNQSGAMPSTYVKLAGATVGTTQNNADKTTTGGLYGGGNKAVTGTTQVVLKSGTASDVYGGGNAATVTDSVSINAPKDGEAKVTNLFCGNNQADMAIHPTLDLQKGEVWTFYGGGNAGAMTHSKGLTYTFDKPDMQYTYIIGGCNAADVISKKGVTLNLENVKVNTAVYAGCNEKGNVAKTQVNILGDVTPVSSQFTSVFGGGRGKDTSVGKTDVRAMNGTVQGTLYGGSGFGRVDKSHVIVKEKEDDADSKIVIKAHVYGAGYGESSVVGTTDVVINTKLRIKDPNNTDLSDGYDVVVTEEVTDTINKDEVGSGASSVSVDWKNPEVSRIEGNVYGGGDMGQVGVGTIHVGSNTAAISEDGYSHVQLISGYVKGDLFGGGNGKPAEGTDYSLNMGAVFGACQTDITGGYVGGSVYGGGYQSRVYANQSSTRRLPLHYDPAQPNGVPVSGAKHDNALATQVNVLEQPDTYDPIIIGKSVFGGGAKGENNSTNPTIYTVVGDVEVNIIGVHGRVESRSTAIYFDQTGGDLGGGLYGDGNLCLVNGEKTVNIRCFNAGYLIGGKGVGNKLKTFYSLQRADVVNVQHSRFVLRGAEDLVDENADDTLYSINRVEQLNMRQNSTIKLNEIVNYLGGLWSDEHYDTRYINRGNNGQNSYTTRGGVGLDYIYDGVPEGKDSTQNGMYDNLDGSIRRVLGNNNRIIHYRNAYMEYVHGKGKYQEEYDKTDEPSNQYANLKSFNEICVANGKYLEIKKNDTEYGDVKGVFILSLLHANPGTGGGFVYASIGDKDTLNSGSTGAFVCVTKDTSKHTEDGQPVPDDQQPYMIISHNVGGYRSKAGGNGDYSYYYWYIKGNKYVYDMKVTGYIGTLDTDFESTAVLTEMEDRHYILKSISGEKPDEDPDASDSFCSKQLVDEWKEVYADSDKYALELKVISSGSSGNITEESIGFLYYQNDEWVIRKTSDNSYVSGKKESTDQEKDFKPNDLITAKAGTTNLELMVVLHKGRAVQTEIRDVPVTLDFDVYSTEQGGTGYDTVKDASSIKINLFTSIVRLVPTQDVFVSAGRIYAGVPTKATPCITGDSAFTVQYITKFMPSAFNTATDTMTECLTTAVEEIYLLDNETGVGFTVKVNDDGTVNLIHATEGAKTDYEIKQTGGGYEVTYTKGKYAPTEEGQTSINPLTESVMQHSNGITLPAGTMITMIAQIDNYTPTYWYYYCIGNETEIDLAKFKKMNSLGKEGETYNFVAASGGNISNTASQRVTENLSFIFDFSKTDQSQETAAGMQDELTGQLRLLHTYKSGSDDVDIMDGVNVISKSGSSPVYTRSYPVVSNGFDVMGGTGNQSLTVNGITGSYAKDTFDVTFTINADNNAGENTRYGEREYSVLLEREKGEPFPAGTTFTYDNQLLTPGEENRSVCIPVKSTGTHTVTMRTEMVGFREGEVKLKATLYSSQDAYYHNELDTTRIDDRTFTVKPNPSIALSVTQQTHLYSPGESMELTVEAKGPENNPEKVSVRLFRYNRSGKNYEAKSLEDVLPYASESLSPGTGPRSWTAEIFEKAAPGTYRLEFQYHDKIEYWDFIVK
ncbi:hypothetical protein ABXS75_03715 [Roseburia hominis]